MIQPEDMIRQTHIRRSLGVRSDRGAVAMSVNGAPILDQRKAQAGIATLHFVISTKIVSPLYLVGVLGILLVQMDTYHYDANCVYWGNDGRVDGRL